MKKLLLALTVLLATSVGSLSPALASATGSESSSGSGYADAVTATATYVVGPSPDDIDKFCTDNPQYCDQVTTLIGCPETDPDCNQTGWVVHPDAPFYGQPASCDTPIDSSTGSAPASEDGYCEKSAGNAPSDKSCDAVTYDATTGEQSYVDADCATSIDGDDVGFGSPDVIAYNTAGVDAKSVESMREQASDMIWVVMLVVSLLIAGAILMGTWISVRAERSDESDEPNS